MDVTSEQTNRLADTTYRNIEDLVVDLKSLVTAAKVYHEAMQTTVAASEHFARLLGSIGAKAANLPGAVRKLGDCMKEMGSGYQQICTQYGEWMSSLNTDFIVPLDTKLTAESKSLSAMRKAYKLDSANRQLLVDKTSKKLKSLEKKKKPSREQLEKEGQLKQVVSDYTQQLHSTRVEGLRKALLEERKLYCFVVDHLCSTIHNEIALNALSHQVLSTKVIDWSSLCSSPNELPTESAILLVDPRSPRAFPVSQSGDQTDGLYASGQLRRIGTGSQHSDGSSTAPPGHSRARRTSCRVRALYPHQGTSPGQLEFSVGDLIDAIDDPQDGWQYGENTRTGKDGWFPMQYVDRIWPTPEPSRRRKTAIVGEGGGASAIDPAQHPPPTGRAPTLQSPHFPDRDYQSPTHRPSSAGSYGDRGQSRKSTLPPVGQPMYRQ